MLIIFLSSCKVFDNQLVQQKLGILLNQSINRLIFI
nr:MAG TPA: hypothetical protein [Caudoviricetes sp.]